MLITCTAPIWSDVDGVIVTPDGVLGFEDGRLEHQVIVDAWKDEERVHALVWIDVDALASSLATIDGESVLRVTSESVDIDGARIGVVRSFAAGPDHVSAMDQRFGDHAGGIDDARRRMSMLHDDLANSMASVEHSFAHKTVAISEFTKARMSSLQSSVSASAASPGLPWVGGPRGLGFLPGSVAGNLNDETILAFDVFEANPLASTRTFHVFYGELSDAWERIDPDDALVWSRRVRAVDIDADELTDTWVVPIHR